MDIKAVELMNVNRNKVLGAKLAEKPVTTTEPPVVAPQKGMSALELQGMNNIAFQGANQTIAKGARRAALGVMMALATLGAASTMTSCNPVDVHQEVTVDMSDTVQQIYDALIAQGKTLEYIVQLLVQNNKDNAEIITLLRGIGYDMATIVTMLQDANAKLGDIFVQMGNMYMEQQEQTDVLNKLAGDNEEFKSYLSNIWEAQKEGNAISAENTVLLNQLLENQHKYGESNKESAQKIIEINTSILEKLSESIAKGEEMDKAHKEFYNQVLQYIAALGLDMNMRFSELYELVEQGLVKMDIATQLLEGNNKLIQEYGEAGKQYAEQIMQYIAAAAFDNNVANGKNYEALVKLTEAVQNNGVKMDIAIQLLEGNNQLIQEFGEEGKALAEQIMQYIAAAAFDNNVANGKNYEAILKLTEAVLNNGVKIDAATDLLSKIKVLVENGTNGQPADLTEIKSMIAELIELNKANGNKLDEIIMQNNVIIGVLTSFKDAVQEQMEKAEAGEQARFEAIMSKLDNIIDGLGTGDCKCNVDFDKLMEKLQHILDAIQNHKCECDCGNGGTNEGIVGDLEDVFG